MTVLEVAGACMLSLLVVPVRCSAVVLRPIAVTIEVAGDVRKEEDISRPLEFLSGFQKF